MPKGTKMRTSPTDRLIVDSAPLTDLGLEVSALGAAILSPSQAKLLIESGSVELFSINFTRDVFAAMVRLGSDSLDCALIAYEITRVGKEPDFAAIASLLDGVVVESPMSARLSRLRELHKMRSLGRLGERLTEEVFAIGATSTDLIARTRSYLGEIER
jgi:replicative DNA helicase